MIIKMRGKVFRAQMSGLALSSVYLGKKFFFFFLLFAHFRISFQLVYHILFGA